MQKYKTQKHSYLDILFELSVIIGHFYQVVIMFNINTGWRSLILKGG
jgi:hypothetical protein